MMLFNLTILAQDLKNEQKWACQLEAALNHGSNLEITFASQIQKKDYGQILFIDETLPHLNSVLDSIDRKGRAIFLIVGEQKNTPLALEKGKVDDVVVFPFRSLEVRSKIRSYQQILMWEEVSRLNASFSEILEKFQEDLRVATQLQKSRLPIRFPDVKGFQVFHRYFAGMRSGGDHFDLADSRDESQLSILLSDSSSYGLSSAVLCTLMRVAAKLSVEQVRSCVETIEKIQEELLLTLNETDSISLFYGIVSRKDYKLRYLNLGDSHAFHASPEREFTQLESHGKAIQRSHLFSGKMEIEKEIQLQPDGRLILLSDGWMESVGGTREIMKILNSLRHEEGQEILNELSFRVRSQITTPESMPPQDCTAVLLDFQPRVTRIAPEP